MRSLKLNSKGEDVKLLQKALHLYPDGIFGPLTEEAVKEFLRSNGLIVDGVAGEKTFAKLGLNQTSIVKSKRSIREIIIHCSATPEGKDFTVSLIKQFHLLRGFSDIGYHYIIYRDGSIHNGRNIDIAGAHCTGHNTISIGVCYIGGCDKDGRTAKDTRTPEQKTSLVKLLKELKSLYPGVKIYSHRDFANKACPSFDATKEYANI